MKKLLYFSGFIAMIISLIFLLSPYGKSDEFSFKLVKNTIEINAVPEKVFSYLGNSANAQTWSVYVDHIIPLNPDSYTDGSIGSERRCFCNPDGKGKFWDERITLVEQAKKRQLTIYNLNGFSLVADHLASEQIYEPVGENKCRLTFTLFFKDHDPGIIEEFKIRFASFFVSSIFDRNLKNIKNEVETL